MERGGTGAELQSHTDPGLLGGRAQRRNFRRWEIFFRSEEFLGPWSRTAAEAGRVGAVVT